MADSQQRIEAALLKVGETISGMPYDEAMTVIAMAAGTALGLYARKLRPERRADFVMQACDVLRRTVSMTITSTMNLPIILKPTETTNHVGR